MHSRQSLYPPFHKIPPRRGHNSGVSHPYIYTHRRRAWRPADRPPPEHLHISPPTNCRLTSIHGLLATSYHLRHLSFQDAHPPSSSPIGYGQDRSRPPPLSHHDPPTDVLTLSIFTYDLYCT